jgi:DNA-binding NtrC family response regulator
VIAATNLDLEQAVQEGLFRGALFMRLKGLWIHIAPLRYREGDVRLLAEHFLAELPEPRHVAAGEAFFAALEGYWWPGNVRELKAAVERADAFCDEGELGPEHLPEDIQVFLRGGPTDPPAVSFPLTLLPLAERERSYFLHAWKVTGGNQSAIGRALELDRKTVGRKLRVYGISDDAQGKAGPKE